MVKDTLSSNLEVVPLISGKVVSARKLGRQLGFPTANIDVNASWLNNGVYGVVVLLHESEYLGVMNIGMKPTVDSNLQKTFEIFLLDFQDNIYGENLGFNILFRIRDEKKFDSFELLKQQIKEDISYAEKRFKLIGLTAAREQNALVGKRVFKSS